jgi:hypothetical protein
LIPGMFVKLLRVEIEVLMGFTRHWVTLGIECTDTVWLQMRTRHDMFLVAWQQVCRLQT